MFGKTRGAVVYLVVLLVVSLVWSGLVAAQQQAGNSQAATPLVRLLQAKGILTPEEVAQISQASSACRSFRPCRWLNLQRDFC